MIERCTCPPSPDARLIWVNHGHRSRKQVCSRCNLRPEFGSVPFHKAKSVISIDQEATRIAAKLRLLPFSQQHTPLILEAATKLELMSVTAVKQKG